MAKYAIRLVKWSADRTKIESAFVHPVSNEYLVDQSAINALDFGREKHVGDIACMILADGDRFCTVTLEDGELPVFGDEIRVTPGHYVQIESVDKAGQRSHALELLPEFQ